MYTTQPSRIRFSCFTWLSIVFACVLFSGCSSLLGQKTSEASSAKLAPIELPLQWQSDTRNLDDGTSHGNNPWGIRLNTQITDLLTQANSTNLELQVNRLRIQQALASRNAARGERLPNLNLNGNYRANETLDADGTDINESHSIGLSSRWELDLWGQLSANVKATKTDLAARQYQFRAAQYALQSTVLITYVGLLEQDYLKRLTRDNVALQERRLDVLYQRLDQGLSTSVDVRNTEQNLLRLQSNEKDLQLRRDRAYRQLQRLLGKPPLLQEFDGEPFPELLSFGQPRVTPSILLERPDLKQREAELLAEGFRWKAAERRKLPRLTINLSSEGRSSQTDNVFSVGAWLSSISASLTAPLLNRAALVNNAKRAKINESIAWIRYQQTLLDAWQDVENGIQAESVLYQREQLLKRSVAQGKAAEELTESLYFQGLATSFELLAAQRTRINAETDYIRVQASRLRNRIQLALALGLPAQSADQSPSYTHLATLEPSRHE